jgi:hypothetical protein
MDLQRMVDQSIERQFYTADDTLDQLIWIRPMNCKECRCVDAASAL